MLRRPMTATFWTSEKDKQLRKLEAAGLSAAQIADRIGTTRNAVIGRSVRLRGLVFPSQVQRQRSERALRAARLHQKKERTAASLAAMRRVMAKGMSRDVAIVSAVKGRVSYQAVAEELGLTRQRVQQIVAARLGARPASVIRRLDRPVIKRPLSQTASRPAPNS
jgi:hypothetical protein